MNQSPEETSKVSRRKLMISAGNKVRIATTSAALGYIASLFSPRLTAAPGFVDQPNLNSDQLSAVPPNLPPDQNVIHKLPSPSIAPTPKPQSNFSSIPLPTSTPELNNASLSEQALAVLKQDLFQNCTDAEKGLAYPIILGQIEKYRADPDLQQELRALTNYSNLANNLFNDLGFYPNSFVRSYLMPLMFVESRGNPKADTKIAKGLCQISEVVKNDIPKFISSEVIKKYSLDKYPLNLFDPQTNMLVAMEYLDYLHHIFRDPGLVLMAYNIGAERVSTCLKIELETNPLVNQNGVNYFTLWKNPVVSDYLKQANPDGDVFRDASLYVPEIAAVHYLLYS